MAIKSGDAHSTTYATITAGSSSKAPASNFYSAIASSQPNRIEIGKRSEDSGAGLGRKGAYYHPKLGLVSTYVFEQKRNVRYYFHEDEGVWKRMPVNWDMKIEREKIDQVKSILPQSGSTAEVMFAIRENNYDPSQAVNWLMECYAIDPPHESPKQPTFADIDALNTRIAELEFQLEAKSKVAMERERTTVNLMHQFDTLKSRRNSLKREPSVIEETEDELVSQKKMVAKCQQNIASLAAKNKELEGKLADAKKTIDRMTAKKTESTKIDEMSAQIGALQQQLTEAIEKATPQINMKVRSGGCAY